MHVASVSHRRPRRSAANCARIEEVAWPPRLGGHEPGEHAGGPDAKAGDDPERDAPTDGLAREGAERHADDNGSHAAAETEAERPGGEAPGGSRRRQGCNPPVRPSGQGGQETGSEQEAEAGSQRREHVPSGESEHGHDKNRPSWQPCGQQGHAWGADDDAGGKSGDRQTHLGHGDTVVGGDQRQEARHHEFAGACQECANHEHVDDQGHAGGGDSAFWGVTALAFRHGWCPTPAKSSVRPRVRGCPSTSARRCRERSTR